MNDEHINEKDFRKYGKSELSPNEFLRVQTHLEICEDCRRRLDEMFPNTAKKDEALLIKDLREAAAEFRKYLKENPNSEAAKRFLHQVRQAQR